MYLYSAFLGKTWFMPMPKNDVVDLAVQFLRENPSKKANTVNINTLQARFRELI
jgi:hypothetical protein